MKSVAIRISQINLGLMNVSALEVATALLGGAILMTCVLDFALGSRSPLTRIKLERTPAIESTSPYIFTSTSASSAAPSPGTSSDVWDTPETPIHRDAKRIKNEVLTPLTPPTPYGGSAEEASVLDKLIKSATRGDDEQEGRQKIEIEDEDDFQPKKLIRNLTKVLQARELRKHNVSFDMD